MKITREEAINLIKGSSDIINVKFIKKDGTLRSMNCRAHVKVNLSTNPNKKVFVDSQHITVYDMISKGYRKINIDTIQSIKKYGTEYTINN